MKTCIDMTTDKAMEIVRANGEYISPSCLSTTDVVLDGEFTLDELRALVVLLECGVEIPEWEGK